VSRVPTTVPLLALAGLLGAAHSAPAQYPYNNPYNRPYVSPYINLLRAGSSPGVNYYGIVRPEVEFRSGINQLQQQTQLNQQLITGLTGANPGPLTTGHPVGFQNHLTYFQNLGAGGQGGTGFGVGLGTGGRPGGAGAQGQGGRGGAGASGSRGSSRGR
jgi:hypothetical protein